MHFVKKINYIEGYKISITFDDKKTKVVDIEPYLKKGVFLLLRDPEYFKMVKVKYDTLVWPNEADFCPDVLYEVGKDIPDAISKKKVSKRHKQVIGGKGAAFALAKKPIKKNHN